MDEWIRLVNVWIFTSARLQTPRLSVKSCSLPRALSVSELLRHRPELTCQKTRLQRQLFYIRKPKLTHWLSLNRAELAVQTSNPSQSSPLYLWITVNYSLAICYCCCFLSQTKSLWWFTKHFSAQVSDKSLAEDNQKDSVAFQSRCVPFLSTTDDFHAPTIVGREWREKRVFIPWNSPRFLLLTELELMAEVYESVGYSHPTQFDWQNPNHETIMIKHFC